MTSTELVKVRSAVSQISTGKDVNEDAWMVMWCNTNWGDLLQPAPLSIALLGSIMVIASSTSDFSLVSEGTSLKLAYAKYPKSFKASLQQMVGDGYTAFETASKQMTRIHNASSQLPGAIRKAVTIILQNRSPKELEYLLPVELDSVSQLTGICMDAAQTCEKAFVWISALAQEILECTTYKIGSVEQARERNETLLTVLQQQAEQEKQMVEEAKQTSDLMKQSFTTAEEQFKTALDNVPSGMGMLAMHVVEHLTNVVTSPMNAFFGMANVKCDYLQTGQSQPQGKTLRASGPTLSDPGISLVQHVLVLVKALDQLISGGPDGKPDWDNIRGSHGKTGGMYVETSLETVKGRLNDTKPISEELLPIVKQALEVTKSVNTAAKSIEANNNEALDQHKPVVKKMVEDLKALVTKCNLVLQQTGNTANGPGTPKDVATDASIAKTAVEMAKFGVDQTRGNLEAARKSYDNASARLIEGQRDITKTIGEMTKLKLENATLSEIIPVLIQAVKSFTTLRAQFSQMMQFFSNVASLINDVMKPQVTTWAKNVEANSQLILAGVALSDWSRHAMCVQMMGPLKVSMLAERISSTYMHVSDLYIMPAQREVGHLLQFQEDKTEEGKREFLVKLTSAQEAIKEKTQAASQKIIELVAEDQKQFVNKITKRLEMIQDTVGQVLPEIKGPVPQLITDVSDAHIEEMNSQKEAVKDATPPYQVDDFM